jgi:hypothetical protein
MRPALTNALTTAIRSAFNYTANNFYRWYNPTTFQILENKKIPEGEQINEA